MGLSLSRLAVRWWLCLQFALEVWSARLCLSVGLSLSRLAVRRWLCLQFALEVWSALHRRLGEPVLPIVVLDSAARMMSCSTLLVLDMMSCFTLLVPVSLDIVLKEVALSSSFV